jgi:membrane protein implicated in regulation of membrane protease activity
MTWWLWFILGFVLLALEMAIPTGFFVFFFGLSAVLVGFLSAIGLSAWPALEWFLFGIFALILLYFRDTLRDKFFKNFQRADERSDRDSLVGVTARAKADLEPGADGRVEMRGTDWGAKNVGTVTIPEGGECIVVRQDSIRLEVKLNS